LGIVTIFILSLFNPFGLKRSFFQIISSKLFFFVFIILLWVGLLEMISRKEYALLKIVLPWVLACLFFFGISFLTLNMNIRIIYPDRHWAYLAILGAIPLGYAFLPLIEKGKKRVLTLLILGLFLLSFVNSIDVQYKYNDSEEFALINWLKSGIPENSTIVSDDRLSGPVMVLAEKHVLWVWTEAVSRFYTQDLFVPIPKYTFSISNYTVWSDQYIKSGMSLDELAVNMKIPQKDKIKFNNPFFDKIFSTQNGITLFRHNKI